MMQLLAQTPADPSASGTLTRVDLKEVQNHFSSSQMIPIEWILLAAGIVLVGISLLSLIRWWKTRHERSSPMLVFFQVALRMGLGVLDGWLLYRIARQQRLPTPLTLMLTPATLEHHTDRFVARFSPGRAEMVRHRVRSIEQRLFGAAEGP